MAWRGKPPEALTNDDRSLMRAIFPDASRNHRFQPRSEEHTSELQSLMLYPYGPPLSRHDALPISSRWAGRPARETAPPPPAGRQARSYNPDAQGAYPGGVEANPAGRYTG